MRISKNEIVAGCPGLTVLTFMRRYRSFSINPAAVVHELDTDELRAQEFLQALESLGLIEPTGAPLPNREAALSQPALSQVVWQRTATRTL